MSRGSRGAPWISAPLTRPSSASTSSSGTFSRCTDSWSLRYVTMGGDPSATAHAELGRSAAAASSTVAASALHGIAESVAAGRPGRNVGAAVAGRGCLARLSAHRQGAMETSASFGARSGPSHPGMCLPGGQRVDADRRSTCGRWRRHGARHAGEAQDLGQRRGPEAARGERRDQEAHRRGGVRPIATALERAVVREIAVVEDDHVAGTGARQGRFADLLRTPAALPVHRPTRSTPRCGSPPRAPPRLRPR